MHTIKLNAYYNNLKEFQFTLKKNQNAKFFQTDLLHHIELKSIFHFSQAPSLVLNWKL